MDQDPWSDVRCYELDNVEDTEQELGRGAYGVVKVRMVKSDLQIKCYIPTCRMCI